MNKVCVMVLALLTTQNALASNWLERTITAWFDDPLTSKLLSATYCERATWEPLEGWKKSIEQQPLKMFYGRLVRPDTGEVFANITAIDDNYIEYKEPLMTAPRVLEVSIGKSSSWDKPMQMQSFLKLTLSDDVTISCELD